MVIRPWLAGSAGTMSLISASHFLVTHVVTQPNCQNVFFLIGTLLQFEMKNTYIIPHLQTIMITPYIEYYIFDVRRPCMGVPSYINRMWTYWWHLTHYNIVTPYGDSDMGQHCLKYWLVTRRHQAITQTNVDFSPVSFLWCSTWSDFTASAPSPILYNEFQNITFWFTATSPRGQWLNFTFRSERMKAHWLMLKEAPRWQLSNKVTNIGM